MAPVRSSTKRTRFQVRPAVGGLVDAALGVLGVQVAERGDVDDVRVRAVDHDAADVVGVVEADVGPGLPAVRAS